MNKIFNLVLCMTMLFSVSFCGKKKAVTVVEEPSKPVFIDTKSESGKYLLTSLESNYQRGEYTATYRISLVREDGERFGINWNEVEAQALLTFMGTTNNKPEIDLVQPTLEINDEGLLLATYQFSHGGKWKVDIDLVTEGDIFVDRFSFEIDIALTEEEVAADAKARDDKEKAIAKAKADVEAAKIAVTNTKKALDDSEEVLVEAKKLTEVAQQKHLDVSGSYLAEKIVVDKFVKETTDLSKKVNDGDVRLHQLSEILISHKTALLEAGKQQKAAKKSLDDMKKLLLDLSIAVKDAKKRIEKSGIAFRRGVKKLKSEKALMKSAEDNIVHYKATLPGLTAEFNTALDALSKAEKALEDAADDQKEEAQKALDAAIADSAAKDRALKEAKANLAAAEKTFSEKNELVKDVEKAIAELEAKIATDKKIVSEAPKKAISIQDAIDQAQKVLDAANADAKKAGDGIDSTTKEGQALDKQLKKDKPLLMKQLEEQKALEEKLAKAKLKVDAAEVSLKATAQAESRAVEAMQDAEGHYRSAEDALGDAEGTLESLENPQSN